MFEIHNRNSDDGDNYVDDNQDITTNASFAHVSKSLNTSIESVDNHHIMDSTNNSNLA